jgi:2-C-methyl-D-erythritol 2,4-cyclodiphosphate synthase
MSLRVGLGFDSHELAPGRPCVLGGVRIAHPEGPVGHSDGDAVLHAVADALLGAAGLEDLGTLFPDRDPKWKGADSAKLLEAVVERVHGSGFRVVNVDIVVATDGPRITPHRAQMRERISGLVGVGASRVNVKGKSFEGLVALARGSAVAVQAVCLVESVPHPPPER